MPTEKDFWIFALSFLALTVSFLLSDLFVFFVKIMESDIVVCVEGAPWEVGEEDDISESEDETDIRGEESADDDDSELNSKSDGIFSLSLSWVRGQTDDDDMFSLSLSDVFDQFSEAEAVASTIIIGLMPCTGEGLF